MAESVITPDMSDVMSGVPPSAESVYLSVEKHKGYLQITNYTYVCGHCGIKVSGWVVADASGCKRRWLLCTECGKGSVQNDDVILPPPQTFPDVDGLPDDIAGLYDEARASFGAQAYTGCEMLCRKILMGVAVDKGAEEKKEKTFVDYVDYLDSSGYVTPPLKKMADSIRKNGNKAAHEIVPPDLRRAKGTLTFTRRILDTVYGVEREIDEYDYAGQTGSSGSPP